VVAGKSESPKGKTEEAPNTGKTKSPSEGKSEESVGKGTTKEVQSKSEEVHEEAKGKVKEVVKEGHTKVEEVAGQTKEVPGKSLVRSIASGCLTWIGDCARCAATPLGCWQPR
jgi:hypothetical protein